MKKYILLIGAVVIASVLLVGCTGLPPYYGIPGSRVLEKQFYAGEQVTITFPEWAIDACDSNSIEDIFGDTYVHLNSIFYIYANDDIDSWVRGRPSIFNDFETLDPDKEYYVVADQDFTLTISE